MFIGNTPLKDIDTNWFRKRVAIVSQEPVLFATTVAKNIAYARDATQEEVQRHLSESLLNYGVKMRDLILKTGKDNDSHMLSLAIKTSKQFI